MDSESLHRFVGDIHALREENRRLRRNGLGAVILLAILFLGGAWTQNQVKSVESEQLVLRNSKGNVCAKLFTDDNGFPNLAFYDDTGRTRLELGLSRDGQGLSIYDERKEGGSIVLDVNRFGASTLMVRGQDGKVVTLLAAKKPSDCAEITLGDDDENQMQLTAGPDTCGIELLRNNLTHAYLLSRKDRTADLTFFSSAEEPLTILGVDQTGKAQVRFLEKNGKLKSAFPP